MAPTSPTSPAAKRARADGLVARIRASETDDTRIRAITPMVPPACLMEDVPSSPELQQRVAESRAAIRACLTGDDDRVLVIAGPCTVHDPAATLDYAVKLAEVARRHSKDILVVMRLNFRKPSRSSGWKGFLHDPHRDGSFAINRGLQLARQLMLRVVSLGLAVGTTFHDTLQPQFFADLVAWLWVAPHATASAVHQQLSSGLSMPVAFCDRGGGADFDDAAAETAAVLDAQRTARMPHAFLSVSKQGVAGIVHTGGNADVHTVVGGADALLRARAAAKQLGALNLRARVLVDCASAEDGSHGDDVRSQARACAEVAAAIGRGDEELCGVMLKSFLLSGRQSLPAASRDAAAARGDEPEPPPPTVYGLSVTDACIDWAMTTELLAQLATAARHRRAEMRSHGGGPRGSARAAAAAGSHHYAESTSVTDNLRIRAIQPLLPPACLVGELPCPAEGQAAIAAARAEIGRILCAAPAAAKPGRAAARGAAGAPPARLLVVVGPSVLHDRTATLEFGGRLRAAAARHSAELLVVMAASFERPHAGAGWKGLVNDPALDNSFRINQGLRLARGLLLALRALGLPTATEFSDTIMPQYLADVTAYSAYDAATASSYLMSELASGLSMPVGVRVVSAAAPAEGAAARTARRLALALASAREPHVFLSVSKENLAGIVHTEGNAHTHAIVVGVEALEHVATALGDAGLPAAPLVACSLGVDPSSPPGARLAAQRAAVAAVVEAVKTGGSVGGVYVPAFLHEGRQEVLPGRKLAYGVSVGGDCFGWDETAAILDSLAAAVRARNA